MKVLNMSDKDFTDKLCKSLGVKSLEKVVFKTPQFERTDGKNIIYFPETRDEYSKLVTLNDYILKDMGCQIWNRTENTTHWLYPGEWFDFIPEGTIVTSISGATEIFVKNKFDDDIRFGALSFGFIQELT